MRDSVLKIAVRRDSGYADRIRTYCVVVDGRELSGLSNGESKTFELDPGAHELRIKINWCGSNTVGFTLAANQGLLFECGSALRGLNVLLAVFDLLFARDKYVWLRLART